jgi:cyclic beta-1,2-glucan synthetase
VLALFLTTHETTAVGAGSTATVAAAEPPRAEILNVEKLEELARTLAVVFDVDERGKEGAHPHRVMEIARRLRVAHRALADDARRGFDVSPAAEWLLDNYPLVEAEVREILQCLPLDYYRELPKLHAREHGTESRIEAMARELVVRSGARLDPERLSRFLKAYQTVAPLTIGELWAWPSALKLALLEELRRLSESLLVARESRLAAERYLEPFASAVAVELAPLPALVSGAFVVRLVQRLREFGPSTSAVRRALDEHLESQGLTVETMIVGETQHQATEQISMANTFGSLRLCATLDWGSLFEEVSLVEEALQRDPAGVYGRMDFLSRDRYRQAVEELAEPDGEAQVQVALRSVERARRAVEGSGSDERHHHVGHHLIGDGRRGFERELGFVPRPLERLRRLLFRNRTAVYLGSIAALTAAGVLLAMAYAGSERASETWLLWTALLALLPASEVAIVLVQRMVNWMVTPRRLPRLDLEGGLPESATTMVIVPTILSSVSGTKDLVDHLQVQAIGNLEGNVYFAVLADLPDAEAPHLPGDEAILAAAREGIESLNLRHARGGNEVFYFFHRERRFNPREGRWMGWERKRGKIEEFNRLLRGATDTSYVARAGGSMCLPFVRYCLTLDTDTSLPRGALRTLVGILSHPLNRARVDPSTGLVTRGYGILQPRVSVTLASGAESLFARVYAGYTGVDPYTTAVSDVYQDLFSEGIFTGKGLYDVDAFMAALEDRVPENALLSHDLFEGLHARVALVSDVEVVDDYPSSVLAHARRQHRWVRGDWQILLWLFSWVPTRRGLARNRIPLIGRFKILDNLRRSLLAPALLVLLAAGWTVLPGSAFVWTGAVVAVLALPGFIELWRLVSGPRARPRVWAVFLRESWADAKTALARSFVNLVLLPYHAWGMLHAIVLTLVRLFITQRRLLEWETAAAASARAAGLAIERGSRLFLAEMAASPITATLLLPIVTMRREEALPAALPVLLLWVSAPFLAHDLSRPPAPAPRALRARDRVALRRAARKTWRYFDAFLSAENNWLPPDNFQQDPGPRLAHRTSPTNIGLGTLSVLAAHDLGYIASDDLAERVERSLDSLETLERFQGHFLNWYDTRTLLPLGPRYVSTVDSGNLAASLLTLASGLRAIAAGEASPARFSSGLADTASLARESMAALASASPELRERAAPLGKALDRVHRYLEARVPADGQLSSEVHRALELLPLAPEVEEARYWANALADTLDASWRSSQVPATSVVARRLSDLAERVEALVSQMDFAFLYDERRKLFALGYRLDSAEGPGRLDPSHYDLLASEARVASFVAIAKGDVPVAHWFALRRPLVSVEGVPTLLSWSATLFEYLMPLLFSRLYPDTLLDRSCRMAVRRQRRYAEGLRVPWGFSESAFSRVDRHGNYQYKAFGVPGLGLKRGLENDLVVAPYATFLASGLEPQAAVDNLSRLEALGLEGAFGFFEAVDFRPDAYGSEPDAEEGERERAVVKAFFAHHQGMTLVALSNLLCGDAMVERFHADPRVKATERLLQEREPREAALTEIRPAEPTRVSVPLLPPPTRRFRSPHTLFPHAHFLSNGAYTVVVTNAGAGGSVCRGRVVTRLRPDPTLDTGGQYLYLRDVRTGAIWSATYQPTCREPDEYLASFLPEKAVFRRRDEDLETQLEIAVSPEDDVEVRRLLLRNRTDRAREIEVTSYAEIGLGPPSDDFTHPAFGKLFVETSYRPDTAALLCRRRPRSAEEPEIFAVHVLSVDGGLRGPVEWETDRLRFLGRGGDPRAPRALRESALAGGTGAVLDPIASLRYRVRLPPRGFARLSFATGVTGGISAASALAQKYHDPGAAGRAISMAFTHAQVSLHHLGLDSDEAQLFDRLASRVFYADRSLGAAPETKAHNALGPSGLWAHGISGDLPILLVRVVEQSDLPLVRQVLQAQEYWKLKALAADVVILNEHPVSYLDEMQEALLALVASGPWGAREHHHAGVHVLRADGMPDGERVLLNALASAVLSGDRGELVDQLDRPFPEPIWSRESPAREEPAGRAPAATDPPIDVPALDLANGIGGFADGGREYAIVLEGNRETPLPWANVIANENFGTVVTASGSAFTWAENSRGNRLTPFANDPVTDPTGEAIYLRDEDEGTVWGAHPSAESGPGRGRWIVRHGAGVTRFETCRFGLSQALLVFAATDAPLKISLLSLTNRSPRPRRLAIYAYNEWALGPPRPGHHAHHVTTMWDEERGAVLARNPYNEDFPRRVAFAAASERPSSATGDRLEFLGRFGSTRHPAALKREALAQRFGAGLDPCAALKVERMLSPGETVEVAFLLGDAQSEAQAHDLVSRYRALPEVHRALSAVRSFWDDVLTTLQVKTPDDSFDLMFNRWLLYQALASRFWARCGYYQPGGAYGFRDQLQDAMAIGVVRTDLFREHLLRAAARQFVEGDVQHWWLPESGRGTRTRCSDDLLWLPYAAYHYVKTTGDDAIWEESLPFLAAPPLGPGETEAYGLPKVTEERASLFEHAVRAIDRGLTAGPHGLPLIGSGDWNDGLNRMGREGRGESVWLGFFLSGILRSFAPLCETRGDTARASRYRAEAARLADTLERAWDGEWYRRGYFDDGTPLGSAQNEECRIDSIPQSWSVLSGVAAPERAERALDAVRTHLVRRSASSILLLAPPFDRGRLDPGYIRGYPPGIRENGGQYTHAALWLVAAMARLGNGDEAMEMFHMLNPVNHARSESDAERYKVEPYVVAADVYDTPEHPGRGGWTWYTGSAGWMYRVGLEELLGLRREGRNFSIDPCIPSSWPGFSLVWRFGGSVYEIVVENPAQCCRGVLRAEKDGEPVDPSRIPLLDDARRHTVQVVLGLPKPDER